MRAVRHEGMPVSRRTRCKLQLDLLARLWLETPAISVTEKRRLITICRNGIHTVADEEVNHIISRLGHVGLRVASQRPQYASNHADAGQVSWEHYHWWELMRDIALLEQHNPAPGKPAERALKVAPEIHVLHQMPLKQRCADVLSVIREHGDPIRAVDIGIYLSRRTPEISNDLQILKGVCLVEIVPRSTKWRLTETADRYTIQVVSE